MLQKQGKTAGLTQAEFGGQPPAAAAASPAPAHEPARKPERKMEERKAPELFKFRAPGDFVEGLLVSMEKVQVKGKSCVQYVIRDKAANVTYQILGTYDINVKIAPADKGRWVQIVYKGTNPDVKKGDNEMMLFDVHVEEKRTEFTDGTQITDDDLPF